MVNKVLTPSEQFLNKFKIILCIKKILPSGYILGRTKGIGACDATKAKLKKI